MTSPSALSPERREVLAAGFGCVLVNHDVVPVAVSA